MRTLQEITDISFVFSSFVRYCQKKGAYTGCDFETEEEPLTDVINTLEDLNIQKGKNNVICNLMDWSWINTSIWYFYCQSKWWFSDCRRTSHKSYHARSRSTMENRALNVKMLRKEYTKPSYQMLYYWLFYLYASDVWEKLVIGSLDYPLVYQFIKCVFIGQLP